MTTDTTTRFVGMLSALVMTLALNGGMLLVFDQLTHDTQTATQTATVSLETVTIAGKRV
jgi:hypothetical protein